MALTEYRRKRDFAKTPEPAGAVAPLATSQRLSFVIQKHAARRLHYDFRLELDGVLKSWAVPKGPSLDPGEKRLAVHVEDHPLEYGGFEGVIPEGQYGAGTALIWDRGTWTPLDPDPDAAYAKGNLKFVLDGEKLHGKWALVRMGGKHAGRRGENWLLIKERDPAAVPQSADAIVADNPRSVVTGRALEDIAADRDRVWGPNGEEPTSADPQPRFARIPGARKARMPVDPRPQLATAADQAPDGPQWFHEIKYDGYRLLARLRNGKAQLLTRAGLDWTEKFPALAAEIGNMPFANVLLDGEIVYLEADGTTNFAHLQDAISNQRTDRLIFYAFDLLHLDGYDLSAAALEDRKATLATLIPAHSAGILRYSDHQVGRGPEFFHQACDYALEGIVSKRRDRPYRPGRGNDWVKVKCSNRDEFVVIGFTDPAGHRQGLGALLLGYHDAQGALQYAGRVGTGFDDKALAELRARLRPLERHTPPVGPLPKSVSLKGVHWSEAELVAEVRYANWTADKLLRHATFLGLRDDKSAAEIVRDADATQAPAPSAPAKPVTTRRPARDGTIEFEGVRLTNPDRVLYPEEGITKLDLARYYAEIADWALPQLAHRPLSVVRCPTGLGGETFFQKHAGAGTPKAVVPVKIDGETHLAIEDLAGLVSLVQIGVLEIHPWGSTVDNVERPDRITFDLDPDIGLPWSQVTAAAIEIRDVLGGFGLQSFAKTTGGKGLHVVVPLTPELDWDQAKSFTKAVADYVAAQNPERYTTNQSKRAREGRLYIDYLRNARGATAIGAYSTRARQGAPIAIPLFWSEVEDAIRSESFTVATVPARLKALKSDPWAAIGTLRQKISAELRRKLGLQN
ncbi:MAG TPA: DNA ligase D [Stellaceae bacterium]|nr:DNA ligase D [Stellaceae bacterium]